MNNIIAIVGMCGVGKSVASEILEELDYKKVYFGGVTMEVLKEEGLEVTPENEKMINIYSNPDGNITYSEYIYPDEENFSQEGISNEELESIVNDFSDFKLKLDNDGEIDEDSLDSFCSFTINLFNKNPEKKDDLITIYTTPDGSVLFAGEIIPCSKAFNPLYILKVEHGGTRWVISLSL